MRYRRLLIVPAAFGVFCAVLFAPCRSTGRFALAGTPDAWPEGAYRPAWAAEPTENPRVEPLGRGEAQEWLRWVIPMPKHVRFQAKLSLPARELSFRLRDGATDVGQAALDELKALLAEKTQCHDFDGSFPVLIGVCDEQGAIDGTVIPGAAALSGLKNADQAYVITPLPNEGLAVVALSERGVYYGVKTLQQLLEPHLAPAEVVVPVVAILDWPDLAERGEWYNEELLKDIRYFADRKLNLMEVHCTLSIDENGRGVAELDPAAVNEARLRAVKVVPIILHFSHLTIREGLKDIYERFPKLKGTGPKAVLAESPFVIAPCASHPRFVRLLADWLDSLASIPGVTDVNLWLSEYAVACGCSECRGRGYVVEAQACVKAWKLARQKHPDLRIRILLSQGSYDTNDKVLAAVPEPEVGITYYDGGRTYDSSRDPMIYPLLEDFARSGRWLGVYPQLTACFVIISPWSSPQFVKYRMSEFADKHLTSLAGYTVGGNRLHDFNVTAAAEWSWNAHGRSERDFTLAWATRRHMAEPEKVADWAVMLGPASWDVYGSGVPWPHFYGHAVTASGVSDRRKPELGTGMFRYFASVEHMDKDVAICKRALALAEEIGDPAILAESRIVGGYMAMTRSIYNIADIVAGERELPPAERGRPQAAFEELARAGNDVAGNLESWKETVDPDMKHGRFADTISAVNSTVSDILLALGPYGIKDTVNPDRERRIGAWHTEDFDQKEEIRKTWDITWAIASSGTYQVRLAYTRGYYGLKMSRVALAVADGEGTADLVEVSVDEHPGRADLTVRHGLYVLDLPEYDANARYYLVADIKGTTSKDKPPAKRGCEGEVWLSRVVPEKPQ